MRTNSRPQVRGAWYYDIGDIVRYRGRWSDQLGRNVIWRVTYTSPVVTDGERQAVTIEGQTQEFGLYRLSTDNLHLDPMGSQQ